MSLAFRVFVAFALLSFAFLKMVYCKFSMNNRISLLAKKKILSKLIFFSPSNLTYHINKLQTKIQEIFEFFKVTI